LLNQNIWVEHGELATEIISTAAITAKRKVLCFVLQRLLALAA
jgi:hypothetical protein